MNYEKDIPAKKIEQQWWECNVCTFVNKNMSAKVCEVCLSKRIA